MVTRNTIETERRKTERRSFEKAPPFPFRTSEGWVFEDRREQPDRRLNSLDAEIIAPFEDTNKRTQLFLAGTDINYKSCYAFSAYI